MRNSIATPRTRKPCRVPGCQGLSMSDGICDTHWHWVEETHQRTGRDKAELRAILLARVDRADPVTSDGIPRERYAQDLRKALHAMVRRRVGDTDPLEWTRTRLTLPFGDGWRGDREIHWEFYPLFAEIMRWITEPGVRRMIIRTATQSGKSTWGMAALSLTANQCGGNTMIVLPSEDLRDKYPRTKLVPCYKNSDIGYMGMEQDGKLVRWSNGSFTWIGLGSSAQSLADTSGVVVAFIDEFDENPITLKHDVVRLVSDRVRPAGMRGKLVMYGTPRRFDSGGLQARATHARDHVPEMRCPSCGDWSVFEMENIKWPDRDRQEILDQGLAYAICPVCGCCLGDGRHRDMVLGARFRCVSPGIPDGERAARIPGWCTTQTNWSRAAYEYLSAEQSADPLQLVAFYNSVAALAVDVTGSAQAEDTDSRYATRRVDYALGSAPAGCQILTAGIDVGVRTLWWWVFAWADSGRKAMVGCGGELYGDEANRTIEQARDAVEEKINKICADTGLEFAGGLIDSGDQATTVYDLCASWPQGGWLPAHGSTHVPVLWRRDKIDPRGQHRGKWNGLILIGHHTHRLQDKLEMSLSTPWDSSGGLALPVDVDKRTLTHLRNCIKEEKFSRVASWRKAYKGAPDHLRDAACLALLAGVIAGVDDLEPVAKPVQIAQEKKAEQSTKERVVVPDVPGQKRSRRSGGRIGGMDRV